MNNPPNLTRDTGSHAKPNFALVVLAIDGLTTNVRRSFQIVIIVCACVLLLGLGISGVCIYMTILLREQIVILQEQIHDTKELKQESKETKDIVENIAASAVPVEPKQ